LLDLLKANASTHLLSLIGLHKTNTYLKKYKKFSKRKKLKRQNFTQAKRFYSVTKLLRTTEDPIELYKQITSAKIDEKNDAVHKYSLKTCTI